MAKLVACKTCGKEVAETAFACPHCGQARPAGMSRGVKVFLAGVGGLALLVIIAIIAALAPSAKDDLAVAAPATPAERQIVERAFCAAVSGDPNKDVAGTERAISDAVERAGVEHVRASFIIGQWFSDLSDHKIPSACGRAIAGYQSAAS
jgi:hypothetical protein